MQFGILIGAAGIAVSLFSGTAFGADTFTMWIRGSTDGFKPVAEAFNSTHENQIQVTEVPADQVVQKYAAAVAAGNAPDALSIDLIYTPAFAAAGQLEDVTEWAKGLPYFDQLAPSHVRLGSYEDRVYGMPFWIETSIFVWNKDLYRQAGLDPEKAPTSWAEIQENARKIAALGDDISGFYFSANCGGCMIFTFAPITWAAGADILSEDGQTATLDNPQMRAAVDVYRTMVKDGVVSESAVSDTGASFGAISSGKIGQQSFGASGINGLIRDFPDLDFGVGLIPGVDGGASSFAGGDNIIITKGSPRVDAVKEFIEWIYSDDGQVAMADYGSMPARADTAEKILEGRDPRLLVTIDAVPISKTPYTTLFNDLINGANSPWTSFTTRVPFTDDGDVDAAFADAQAEMQAIIDDAR